MISNCPSLSGGRWSASAFSTVYRPCTPRRRAFSCETRRDHRSWQEIREDYGPNGLLGYDLVNGYADVTSYTQIAAFTCNGLLFGLTRGQMLGKMAPFIKYIALSSQEWAASQRAWGRPSKCYCWLLRKSELCTRRCMDTRMLDTLSRQRPGTLETPVNNFDSPAGITSAVGVGLFYNPDRMEQTESDRKSTRLNSSHLA